MLNILPRPLSRDVQISILLIGFFFVFNVFQLWNEWAVDLSAYYFAGYFFDIGQYDQIYAGPPQIIGPEMPETWIAALNATGHADENTYPFIYLPWVAAVMAPVSRYVDPQHLMNGAAVMNSALMMLCMGLAWRIMSPKQTPVWLWVVISVVLLSASATSVLALALGQVQILVFTFCLFAFERYRAGAFWIAGAALAIAACLKITPALLILIFLWDRNWRALGGFTCVCVTIGLLGVLATGIPLHEQFFDLMRRLNQQVFISPIAFSVEGLAYQVWDYVQGTAPIHSVKEFIYAKPDWIDQLAKIFFLGGIAAIWLTTRQLEDEQRMPRQLLGLSLLIPLTAPLGWVHYFLLTTYLLPGLLEHMNKRLAGALLLVYFVVLNAHVVNAMLMPGMRVMLPIVVCVPMLIVLFWTIIAFGYRPSEIQNVHEPEIVPAE